MSTIHEALKRAQKERDGRLTPYGRLMSSRERVAGFTPKGWGFWVVGALMVVLLAFVLYSWLDFTDPSETAHRPVEQKPPSASPESVKEKPTAQSFVEQGRRYHREGRFREARQCYEKALKTDPGDALATEQSGGHTASGTSSCDCEKAF
ncbi:MAG: tetratricopeptide repeat protein [Deltaproteobacteria bacterium]|nr:tetratricopeptide repeat protein [Deltaproteobacteria bacterium]